MPQPYLLAGCLLALSLPGFGQQAPAAAPASRYYVGLALLGSDLHPLRWNYRGPSLPVQLTLGYQLRPRLAVQLGLVRTSSAYSYFGVGQSYNGYGAPSSSHFEVNGSWHDRTITVAPVLRYTLTRQAGHRFQLDALLGVAYLRYDSDYYEQRTELDSTNAVTGRSLIENHGHGNALLLRVGLSPRYHLGRHLEAVADFTLSHGLLPLSNNVGFDSGAALGLRYRFGSGR